MTFLTIAGLCVVFTIISLRWRNIAFALVATLSWLGLWVYNLESPPSGVDVGSLVHDVLNYALLVMTGGVMVAYLYNRSRGYTGYERSASEQRTYNEELKGELDETPIAYMNQEQYRRYIHGRRTSTRSVRR